MLDTVTFCRKAVFDGAKESVIMYCATQMSARSQEILCQLIEHKEVVIEDSCRKDHVIRRWELYHWMWNHYLKVSSNFCTCLPIIISKMLPEFFKRDTINNANIPTDIMIGEVSVKRSPNSAVIGIMTLVKLIRRESLFATFLMVALRFYWMQFERG